MLNRFVGCVANFALAVGLVGCESALYGEGALFIWNGTEETVEFNIKGRTPGQTRLKFERGELFDGIIAGGYTVTAIKDGVPLSPVSLEVAKDRMTVFNFDSVGCFARADVSGMYRRGKAPVRTLEIYRDEQVMPLQNAIAVKPGQRLPGEAPRLTRESVLQRLVVIPCSLAEEEEANEKVAEFVRRLR